MDAYETNKLFVNEIIANPSTIYKVNFTKTKIMECYTLWTANAWLMRDSFSLHGIFSSLEKAIEYAKRYKLLASFDHVLIDKGTINNYDNTSERVFSTEFEESLSQLKD